MHYRCINVMPRVTRREQATMKARNPDARVIVSLAICGNVARVLLNPTVARRCKANDDLGCGISLQYHLLN